VMSKTTESGEARTAGCVLFLLWLPVGIILRGWVISRLWSWFIPATFGLPSLTVARAIGLSIIVSVFTAHIPRDDDKGMLETMLRGIGFALLFYGLALLTGWITKAFV
jgi:hypothetical protein